MGVAIFFVLALLVAGVIVYPLLPGRASVPPAPVASDADIERAVRNLRRARRRGGLSCPTCGLAYQAGDRFCVQCGNALPQSEATPGNTVCPSCGATLRAADRFCATCGYRLGAEEAS